ncbi:hypothetical protein O181_007532 [Austropuccinia psidii MF-1]|uniref:Uncharacterized protein n=1 Tax=Austropuccinia psidii MF-1 TaxID=1389203 RepID=A0A9Q3GIK4_9BASI|nr:hypothetical protein [Austropuccinia psidii MF-1]
MQEFLLSKIEKKGKIMEQTPHTPGASPRETNLQRHVGPENSPISPTPGPREIPTPETEPRIQKLARRTFFSTPNHPLPSKKKVPWQDRCVV